MARQARMLWGFIFLLVTMPCAVARAAETAPRMVERVGHWDYVADGRATSGRYLAFTPADWDDKTPLPLVILLHGAGYRGQDATKLEDEELVKQIRGGRTFDAIVLFPQVSTYWNGEQAATFIDCALDEYSGRFDPDCVYLTGESAGGGGAWEGAKLRADKLAALVPIATTIGRADGAAALIDLPTWAFHNIHDPYQGVEKSRAQVEAIRAAGGKYVFYTEYTDTPGKQHERKWPNAHRHAWETAYRDPALWEWLFRQRRGRPELALSPPPAPTKGTTEAQ